MDAQVGGLSDPATAAQAPGGVAAPVTAAAASGLPWMYVPGPGGQGSAQPPAFGPQHQNGQQQVGTIRGDTEGRSCNMCRARKVGCGGKTASGACKQCEDFDLKDECNFDKSKPTRVTPSRDRTEAGTVRRRAQRACTECHKSKAKCSGDHPRCERCAMHGLRCEYLPSKRGLSNPPLPPSDRRSNNQEVAAGPSSAAVLPSPISPAMTPQARRFSVGDPYAEDLLARRGTLLRHFDVFFSLWAPMPCMGIMHRDTTYAEIHSGELQPVVAAAVCAMTSRIIASGQKHIPFAKQCADHVDGYLIRTMGQLLRKTAHEKLLVLVCVICHFWHEYDLGKVWMYMGLAGRLITALQLNWHGEGESLVKQEMNRRLVWAFYILDRLLAGGFDEYLGLRDDGMHLELPVSDEVLYEAVRYEASKGTWPTPKPSNPNNLCLDGYYVRLHKLRHQILGLTKPFAPCMSSDIYGIEAKPLTKPFARRQQMEASKVIELVNDLQNQLFNFRSQLPKELLLTHANINRFLSSPEGPSFVMLHSLFKVLHIDLYRFTVPGIREAASPDLMKKLPGDFIYKSQRQAVGFAVSLSRFWRILQGIVAQRPSRDGTEKLLAVDQMFAIFVVQPTKILLAARRHRLFNDLESSTATLVHEPVDDAALAALVQSNMQLIAPLERFFPRMSEITQEIRDEVNNFSHIPHNDHVSPVGTPPAAGPSRPLRLPPAQGLLERVPIPEEADRDEHRNRSAADHWLQHKKINTKQSPAPMTPLMSVATGSAAAISPPASGFPEIPAFLAEARACDLRPESPSQDRRGTSSADAQASSSNQPGVGLGMTRPYRFGDARPMSPPPRTNPDMVRQRPLPPPLILKRATGSESAAAASPGMYPGNGQAGFDGRNPSGPSSFEHQRSGPHYRALE